MPKPEIINYKHGLGLEPWLFFLEVGIEVPHSRGSLGSSIAGPCHHGSV
jgi:hypothetical protein